MLLKRWEPLADLEKLDRGIDRVWRYFDVPYYLWRQPFVEALGDNEIGNLDVYHHGENLVVKAELSGVKPKDLDVTIEDNLLTIKGEAKAETEVKEEEYLHRERWYGSFKRVINLPKDHLADKAEASFENGVLTITVPKGEETKAKSIKVNVA